MVSTKRFIFKNKFLVRRKENAIQEIGRRRGCFQGETNGDIYSIARAGLSGVSLLADIIAKRNPSGHSSKIEPPVQNRNYKIWGFSGGLVLQMGMFESVWVSIMKQTRSSSQSKSQS